ncbi:MAG: O-antigen ligase family protein [Sedimenticola sp.]|nr:O-antigen ligase family protein [Sedimenticola sp.]
MGWFHRHALLLPVIVMASYYIGRGLGDTLQLFYLLCGLYALKYMDLRPYRLPVILLVLLLSLFLISVFYPDFSARSLKYWMLYGLSGMVMVFTLGASVLAISEVDRRVLIGVSIALLLGVAIDLGYFFFVFNDFHPATQVNGMILATLAPLIFFYAGEKPGSTVTVYSLFYIFSLAVLLVSDSRTELLMLLIGAAFYLTFFKKKLFVLFVIIPVILLVAIIADGYFFSSQLLTIDGSMYQWLDQLSSKRLSIWAEAIAHPPENYLTGTGMKRSIEFLNLGHAKHLHNMFIEIWYETGLLSLLVYIALLVSLLAGLRRAYQQLEGFERRIYAIFLATGSAALISGILDKSYLHPLTRYYMLFCFSVLYLHHHRCSSTRGRNDGQTSIN